MRRAKQLDAEIAEALTEPAAVQLTKAQRTALGNVIARGGVSNHELHMGRMSRGDVRRSVLNKLLDMGLVRGDVIMTDVYYGRRGGTLHQGLTHYYATAAGIAAYGSEPARLE